MLETAQECVEVMNKEVTGLHVRLINTLQEARRSYSRRSQLLVAQG